MTLYNSFIEELPLILFTVIAQGAVGFSLLYSINNANTAIKDESYKKFGLIFLIFVIISMITSIFHLGTPLHIPYMLGRVFGFSQDGHHIVSWLPLEIVGIGLMLLVGIIVFLKGTKLAIYALPIVGIAMLYAMGNIYGSMASTIPTWNLNLTLFLFFSSALLLGSVMYSAFIAKSQKEYSVSNLASVIGFTLFVLSLALYTFYLGNLKLDVINNVFDLASGSYIYLMGWGIVLSGIGICLLLLKRNFSKLAFMAVLVGILLTRILFYGLITSHIFLG